MHQNCVEQGLGEYILARAATCVALPRSGAAGDTSGSYGCPTDGAGCADDCSRLHPDPPARRHSVPFVVLCGIYKLSTLFPHNPGAWATARRSSAVAACSFAHLHGRFQPMR